MRAALTVLLAALALGAARPGAPATAKESHMDGATAGKTVRVYAGRFSLEVPADARYGGGEQSMRYYGLKEVGMPGRPEEAWQKTFGAKLAHVAELKRRRMRPTWIDGEIIAQVELSPGPDRFTALLYHPGNAKLSMNVAALRQRGTAGLWVERSACDVDDREAILKDVGAVGRAWQPLPEGAPRPKGDAFHLPAGVMALPFGEHEAASAQWSGGPLELQIELSTESTDAPRKDGLMARFGDAVARAGAAFTAGASVVRNRGRRAAGLDGEEFVMRSSEEGMLSFVWEFKGEAGSGTKPRIQLEMTTRDERQKEKMAAWDALVDSLRPAASP